jgi:hypothetical protein
MSTGLVIVLAVATAIALLGFMPGVPLPRQWWKSLPA